MNISRKTKSPLSFALQRASKSLKCELPQMHPRRRAVRVMMMAMVLLERHPPKNILAGTFGQ
jgi:hypothetical protein